MQTTGIQLPKPPWRLTTACHSSSRDPEPSSVCLHTNGAQTKRLGNPGCTGSNRSFSEGFIRRERSGLSGEEQAVCSLWGLAGCFCLRDFSSRTGGVGSTRPKILAERMLSLGPFLPWHSVRSTRASVSFISKPTQQSIWKR